MAPAEVDRYQPLAYITTSRAKRLASATQHHASDAPARHRQPGRLRNRKANIAKGRRHVVSGATAAGKYLNEPADTSIVENAIRAETFGRIAFVELQHGAAVQRSVDPQRN